MAELVRVVEAGSDGVAEGLDRPFRGVVDARAGGQGRGQGQVMGQIVEIAGFGLGERLDDLDRPANGLRGIGGFAQLGESLGLAGRQFSQDLTEE